MWLRHHKGLVWGGLVALVLGLGVSLVVLYAHRTTSSSPPLDGPAASRLPKDSVPKAPAADGTEAAAPTRHEYRTEVPAAEGSETEAPTRHEDRTELTAADGNEIEEPPVHGYATEAPRIDNGPIEGPVPGTAAPQAAAPAAPEAAPPAPPEAAAPEVAAPEGAATPAPEAAAPAAPTPPVSPTPAPPPPQDTRQLVTVLYATNRIINPSTNEILLTQVTNLRDAQLGFGSAIVRIPENHKFGQVERPREFNVAGYTLWREGLDEKKHFVMRDLHVISESDFIEKVKSDGDPGILVYVHGFNTDFGGAIFSLAQIVFDSNFRGLPIAFLWPSQGGLLSYDHDREMALASRQAFRDLLKMLYENASVKKIYVLAHSMGNQIVVESLYQESLGTEKISLSELVLAAPDVDLDVFSSIEAGIKKVARGITIYASASDKALRLSKLKAGGVRLGDVPDTGPVIFAGIDTIDVTALGEDVFELNHSVFSSSRSAMDDLGRILQGIRPPGARTPQLRGLPDGSDPPRYWRYPQ